MSHPKVKIDKSESLTEVEKGAEYSQLTKVMLSVFDELIGREFTRSEAISIAKETYNSFLMYKANVESPFTLIDQEQEA